MNTCGPQSAELTYRDVQVGDTFKVERTFTGEDIRAYAALSGDFSPLHLDPVYAASTELGTCVVHGMLLASLFSQLVGMRIPGKRALYLAQDLAFRKPVFVGDTVTAYAKVIGKNDVTGTLQLSTEIHNAEGKVLVSGSAKVKVRNTKQVAEALPPSLGTPVVAQHVALVTGASRGIGAEIARTLAARGVVVAVNYFRSADSAERVVREILSKGGSAVPVQADVREAEDVRRLVETVAGHFGRLDLLVNGAIGDLHQERFMNLDWSAFCYHLDYQLKAVVQTCQAAYPFFKRAGGGSVVNLLSQVASGVPPVLMADYVTAKHALHGLSKALATEWAADGIRVNMVSPGLTQTDLTQHFHDRVFKMEASRTPLRRVARPADIAKAVAFLLSEEAEFLTGVNVSVTGGQVMD